ncbi:MAG: hypothetical protein JOZ40_09130, partial [Methylobacteriaceae bacterium]|nr:hypothetical protein [Methylobacteriaceae bacterium]
MLKTDAGGEINCVDQGDFSGGMQLFIGKSLTIDCEGIQARFGYAGIAAIAIIVSAGAAGTGHKRQRRCRPRHRLCRWRGSPHREMLDPQFRHRQRGVGNICRGRRQRAVGALRVRHRPGKQWHSVVGGGIEIQPIVSSSTTKVTLNRVEVRNNFFGIKVDGTMTTGGVVNMTVRDSISVGNASNGIVGTGNAAGPAIV